MLSSLLGPLAIIGFGLFWFSSDGREIQILDEDNQVVGECYAGFDWHFYGLQDSIDYMLYQCAKESIEQGYTVSDKSLLTKDFSLPPAPVGERWTKESAMRSYHDSKLSEAKLGYLLAALEFEYQKQVWAAEEALEKNEIRQAEFDEIEEKARIEWQGK